jgi:hypothetical protein
MRVLIAQPPGEPRVVWYTMNAEARWEQCEQPVGAAMFATEGVIDDESRDYWVAGGK